MKTLHAVTGAFGYSGKYIAEKLLQQGYSVITLTNSLQRANPFQNKIQAFPLDFNNPAQLQQSLSNVSVLYNTYWVRFNHKNFTYAQAVKNTKILFQAAKKAGVERIVHISITNPDIHSKLEYFRGKAQLEEELKNLGISYAILRPAVLFGKEDILVNNIAWALRRLPFFGICGKGNYRLQPIYVDDLAKLAVEWGQKRENTTLNAIGPETFTFQELVQTIAQIIGINRPLLHLPPYLVYLATKLIGWWQKDVFLTWDEIQGLMANLLWVPTPPTGKTKLTEWAKENAPNLGKKYASELARRRNRKKSYQQL
ncbi:MAG: NAD-dependent epimerase/dehydratase family protein [Planctomycetota bacterium]|nr:MAG: NAD-dependent epimerase/dehydratase family protein [Planctomycetota bacterium]